MSAWPSSFRSLFFTDGPVTLNVSVKFKAPVRHHCACYWPLVGFTAACYNRYVTAGTSQLPFPLMTPVHRPTNRVPDGHAWWPAGPFIKFRW
eukprot:scaffold255277_cov47-Prasinocladus_malaysianus.AAC.1